MKIVVGALLAASVLPTHAQTEGDVVLEEACIPVREGLQSVGAGAMDDLLFARKVDFKYGQFTIFAPPDQLLTDSALILQNAGYSDSTVNDIALFHVSSEGIHPDVLRKRHCGVPLLMLNEELHNNQENSVTYCHGGNVYQMGPGNFDNMPVITGDPVPVCNGIIYPIDGALMMPTLPANVTKSPTPVPPATKVPTRQTPPTQAPVVTPSDTTPATPDTTFPAVDPVDDSASSMLLSKGSIALTALTALVAVFF